MSKSISEIAQELSEIEKQLLKGLDKKFTNLEEIGNKINMNLDSARRASAWLSEKGLVEITEEKNITIQLTLEGKKAFENGLPEEKLLNTLKKIQKGSFDEIATKANLSKQELMASLGTCKKNAYITIVNGIVEYTGVYDDAPKTNILKEIIEKINSTKKEKNSERIESSPENKEKIDGLIKRGLLEKKEIIERKIKITSEGIKALEESKDVSERKFDVEAPVPKIFAGKKAPYMQFIKQIRQRLVNLGFNEMKAPLVVSEFYNFDVLFQPQNHPARTWTDSYVLKAPTKGTLPDKKIVDSIKAAHENGGKAKSKGWGYDWKKEIAERAVPAMHGTAHSARQLVEGVETPKKYFAVARCFRPDVLDATHLIEFNQMEGFVVGENLNFKHLLGMLKDFAIEFAGAEEVKFLPDYYPFTEPSVQLSAKHPEMGWIEFAGAGMFRPEMLENLGIKGEAIAWGVGIDRLAMFKLGIKDIRYLFAEDIDYLRNSKGVLV